MTKILELHDIAVLGGTRIVRTPRVSVGYYSEHFQPSNLAHIIEQSVHIYIYEYIIKIEQLRPGSYLRLASPLKLLKHQLNRHHCGRLHYWSTRRVLRDHSNHLLLLFSGLSDAPLRLLCMGVYMCVCVCVCACACVRAGAFCLFAIHACLEMVASKQAELYGGA